MHSALVAQSLLLGQFALVVQPVLVGQSAFVRQPLLLGHCPVVPHSAPVGHLEPVGQLPPVAQKVVTQPQLLAHWLPGQSHNVRQLEPVGQPFPVGMLTPVMSSSAALTTPINIIIIAENDTNRAIEDNSLIFNKNSRPIFNKDR